MTPRQRLLARMAGNVASGLVGRRGEDGLPEFDLTAGEAAHYKDQLGELAGVAVDVATAILTELGAAVDEDVPEGEP